MPDSSNLNQPEKRIRKIDSRRVITHFPSGILPGIAPVSPKKKIISPFLGKPKIFFL
jgi:hypothetical protein